MIGKDIKSVSELTRDITSLLEGSFRFVRVAGEISGIRRPFSGHYYFVLKDDQAQIRAVLFKTQQAYLAQPPRDGQQVICDGRITVYGPRGEYQIIVDTIDFHGSGRLQIAFEQLKQRLKEQGYFAPERKRSLPAIVSRIVLITSPSGAAVHDFLTICRKRRIALQVQLLPVRVQGEGAAREISSAIRRAHDLRPDVIVLCRGGGSIEDLWAFNEEEVARAVYQATIPVVTGVGHETDFTIADFCADIRAATPTAAAELVVADGVALGQRLAALRQRLWRSMTWYLDSFLHRLDRVNRCLAGFETVFGHPSLRLDQCFSRLLAAMSWRLERYQHHGSTLANRLRSSSPEQLVNRFQIRIEGQEKRLQRATIQTLNDKTQQLQKAAAVLDSLSPLATLARGYAVVLDRRQRLVSDYAQVEPGDPLSVRLHRGRLQCRVTHRSGSDEEGEETSD